MRHPHPAPKTAAVARPNAQMSMSSNARASMRVTEKAIYQYYNDMAKNKGNCTWGAGILAHRGVCSEEELMRTVSAQSVDIVFGQKVAEAEGIVRRLTAKLVEPGMYLREQAHASAELLHLPNPVTVVELGCTIAFIKNPQTIVVLWKGWFFDAKRMR